MHQEISGLWQNTTLPARVRAADLLSRMTLEEKAAQLVSVWPGATSGVDDVAPQQHELAAEGDLSRPLPHGLGQLTRQFGTVPVEPGEGAARLARVQRHIAEANRFGIPAVAHEECLTGLTAWKAAIFPTPLAWGAAFDPDLVRRAAALIGSSMRAAGIHQGLAPVLDVVRDPRWGRTEETIGEDPYLVAAIGTAYVQGLQQSGIIATLKHYAGYAASRGARNHGPVSIGPRELADVVLPPFEAAIRAGGARSVMAAYNDLDGVPCTASSELLTGLLRDKWGFSGTVVADYFGISFLELNHGVADSPGAAGALALRAGVDVELPAAHCFGQPLAAAVESGELDEAYLNRAALRVLEQKCELGLLDPDWSPEAELEAATTDADAGTDTDTGTAQTGPVELDFDPPEMRALARQLAEESLVLLSNDGTLPLGTGARIAVTGPFADDPAAMLGCYTFPRHVGVQHPELPLGVEIPTLLGSLTAELADAAVVPATTDADVIIAALGDRSGLFGRGTSGEGCDVPDLELPDGQGELLDTLLATGKPVVLVLFTGRPYALGRWADRLAAVVQAFFPGEEGGPAVAGVLTGRLCPSGRLPVSVPREPGGQPWTYIAPTLGQAGGASVLDPTPLYPFGHGLSYTTFAWESPVADAAEVPTDDEVSVRLTVRNTGERAGIETVQLYLHDPLAQTAQPVVRLVGFARVRLDPGESAEADFTFHADLSSYTGPDGRRIVEPGGLELRLGRSSADTAHTVPLTLTGPERTVDHERRLLCPVRVK